MIIGIGCDVVQIPRIEALVSSSSDRFLRRIFSDIEMQLVVDGPDKCSYIAKRFAAKEAFAKALGSGIGRGIEFRDIEILKMPSGQPFFSEKTLLLAGEGVAGFLSMSDDYPIAIAQVVLCTHKHTLD